MEELMQMLKNIDMQMQIQKKEISDSTKSIISLIDRKFTEMESKYTEINKKIEEQEKRIDQMEMYIRRKNIVIFGVEEKEKNYEDLTAEVISFINKKMSVELSLTEIESVHRLGKKRSKIRPIILSLTTVGKKIKILKNKHTLKDTPYYIKEHYTQKILRERKNLNEKVKKLRDEGRNAIIKHNKIIILNHNTEYSNNKKNSLESLENLNSSSKKPLPKRHNKNNKK